ncbi:MAG: DUF2799 domain-containing protein [Qingshengfaniella sp.]
MIQGAGGLAPAPIRHGLALVAVLLLVAGCGGALDAGQCRSGDWRAIGMADGLEGHGPDRLQRHVTSCAKAGIFPDTTAYQAGLAEGLALYCVAETGYARGRSGASFPEACTAIAGEDMQAAYAFGRRYWELGQQADFKRSDLREGLRNRDLLPSERVLLPTEIRRLEQEQRDYAVWPQR